MASIRIEIVSAEGEIYSGSGTGVFAPAEMGEIGILPGHAPLLARLNYGPVRVAREAEEDLFVYVKGGMLEVQPDVVTVLADTAIRASDLDEASLLEAKAQAEEAVKDKCCNFDWAMAQSELAQMIAQLRTLEQYRQGRK